MPVYNFKRDAEIFVVYGGNIYQIDISDITFSQTLLEKSISSKTIQSQEMFERSKITKANPANFSLTIPAIREDDLMVLFNRALDYNTFDIYIKSTDVLFKLEKSIITNTSFILDKFRPLSLSISGDAAILSKEDFYSTIPGTLISRSSSRTYNRVNYLEATLNGLDTFENVTSISIELQTEVTWLENRVLSNVCSSDNVIYPDKFYINKQVLSGSIANYKIEEQTWNTSTPLYIKVGQKINSDVFGFILDLSAVSYTSRVGTGDIYTSHYDWRLVQNPASLLELIQYVATTGVTGGNEILDSFGDPILDSDGFSILDSV